MTKLFCRIALLIGLAPLSAALAQAPNASVEATHSELRKLKDATVEAINAGDYSKILPLLHSNVVVTAENSEVVRSSAAVEQFYKKLLTGPEKALNSFRITELNVDELSILYGDDTAIAFGSGKFEYNFVNGSAFQLPCRWTATLVRENGQWLLAAFHNSVNVADNPVLDLARKAVYKFSIIASIVGILIGAFLGRFLWRREG